jgi:di/tricarboxylate transporter
MILTELITDNAAAALMFPFGLSLAAQLGVSPMPFCVAVMFAASASFSTPIGYQTNLMVYGPGGYRFADYFRLGIPLQLVAGVVAWLLIPFFFPF